jgi:peptidylprolyl isomerase
MKKPIRIAAAAAALALFTLVMPGQRAQGASGQMTEMGDGLKSTDTQVGTGKIATAGHRVTVNYTGWLYENGAKGKKFDSSLDRAQPFQFNLGGGEVIKGWDEGVAGMKEGGKRTLIIPPALGYGSRGAGGVIPPFATLMFDVELIKVD